MLSFIARIIRWAPTSAPIVSTWVVYAILVTYTQVVIDPRVRIGWLIKIGTIPGVDVRWNAGVAPDQPIRACTSRIGWKAQVVVRPRVLRWLCRLRYGYALLTRHRPCIRPHQPSIVPRADIVISPRVGVCLLFEFCAIKVVEWTGVGEDQRSIELVDGLNVAR